MERKCCVRLFRGRTNLYSPQIGDQRDDIRKHGKAMRIISGIWMRGCLQECEQLGVTEVTGGLTQPHLSMAAKAVTKI